MYSDERFNDRQRSHIATMMSDVSQVCLASIILPALGFGGKINFWWIFLGGAFIIMFVYFSLFLLRSHHKNVT
jgi:hypothetical protein